MGLHTLLEHEYMVQKMDIRKIGTWYVIFNKCGYKVCYNYIGT